jgi:hypothetical protein
MDMQIIEIRQVLDFSDFRVIQLLDRFSPQRMDLDAVHSFFRYDAARGLEILRDLIRDDT